MAIHDDGGALWREPVFVRVARDGGDTIDAEVEGHGGETSLLEERYNEGAETAVDVHSDPMVLGEQSEGRDVVGDAVGELDS